jgi:hypothetical protein
MQMEHVSAGNVEGLEVVREEEEESQTLESVVRTKRKAGSSEDEDPKMRDRVRVLAGPVLKKRAIEHMNAVEPTGPEIDDPVGARATKPPFSTAKSTKAGAPPGKPDTDAAFLKALASTQRGRKHEDSFDREFNKLKISKPDLGREEHEEEWAVLADFGDDGNVRGNFMVVVEMDIFKKEQSGHREGKVEWEGKVNFKRFKVCWLFRIMTVMS